MYYSSPPTTSVLFRSWKQVRVSLHLNDKPLQRCLLELKEALLFLTCWQDKNGIFFSFLYFMSFIWGFDVKAVSARFGRVSFRCFRGHIHVLCLATKQAMKIHSYLILWPDAILSDLSFAIVENVKCLFERASTVYPKKRQGHVGRIQSPVVLITFISWTMFT